MSSGISAASMNLQFINDAAAVSSMAMDKTNPSAEEIKTEEAVYAKEGDPKYDEAMDENSDGTITYEEYMNYVSESLASAASAEISPAATSVKTDSEGNVQPVNAGRALAAYSNASSSAASLNSAVISAES